MTKFLKRIGAKKIHFDFEILIKTLALPNNHALDGQLKISFKKGKREVQTKEIHKLEGNINCLQINETCVFPATLFFNKKHERYLPKPVNSFFLKKFLFFFHKYFLLNNSKRKPRKIFTISIQTRPSKHSRQTIC